MLFDNLSSVNRYSDSRTKVETSDKAGKESLKIGKESLKTGKETLERNDSEKKQVNEKEVKIALDHANKQAKLKQTSCEFSYNEKAKRVSIKVKDKKTDEIIKEIPAEETLKLIEKMQELSGIILDEKG